MKLLAIVCLALIAAVNARPGGEAVAVKALFDDYAGIKGARDSAAEIALAGAGLSVLETQLQAFGEKMATITLAETTVETAATPYV